MTSPQTPPMLAMAHIRPIWTDVLDDNDDDVVLLLDERLCLIRVGLTPAALNHALDNLWDVFWTEYGNTITDLLTAEILTGQRPDRPHAPSAEQPAPTDDAR